MTLQGTLKDFSISEIIQLIGQQLKTGVLNARQRRDVVEIHFIGGMIVDVSSNRHGKGDFIGKKLVRAKLITQEQLDRALGIQKETSKFLGEILIELQFLSKDNLFKAISTQVCETIYDLFWWEEGNFYFEPKMMEGYKKHPFALSAEEALLNILRMVDEWPEIEKKIPSSHLTFRRVPGTEGKSYTQGKLTPDQESILGLACGSLTVREIIDQGLLGKFHTSEILVNLMEMGLIEAAEIQAPGLIKKMGRLDLGKAVSAAYYPAFLLLVGVAVASFKPDLLGHVWKSGIERPSVGFPSRLVHQSQADRIKNGLRISYLERGEYPKKLEELIPAQLIRRKDIIDFQYERTDKGYTLRFRTEDR